MKTAIVTGASRGIGLAIAEHLSTSGYNVFATARSPMRNTRQLEYLCLDMRNEESHFEAVDHALERTGRLDLYVNNAGISEWRRISSVDLEFLDKIFSLNTYAYFFGCKAAASVMKSGSCIINISSIAGRRGSANNSVYAASKFAVTGLTQSLAKELGPRGIRVNAVCPVLVSTPGLLYALTQQDAPGMDNVEHFMARFIETQSALGHLPELIDVARMCSFLASENAKSITGQSINVDCGVLPN